MVVYKYTVHWKDFIQNPRIRASPISALNDPFEVLPPLKLVLRESPKQASRNTLVDNLIRYFIRSNHRLCLPPNNVVSQRLSGQGIVSLSACGPASEKAILLWAHYADEFKGIAIEFDSAAFPGLKPVSYGRKRGLGRIQSFDELFFKKHPAWKYEQEWRKVFELRKADHFKINSKGMKLIYDKDVESDRLHDMSCRGKYVDDPNVYCFFDIDKKHIKAIYLGPLMTVEDQDQAYHLIQTHIPGCKVYQTMPSPNDYSLYKRPYEHHTSMYIEANWRKVV